MTDQRGSAEPPLREDRSASDVPLAMDPEEFRRVGRELVDRIARHLEELPEGPVTPGQSPQEIRDKLGAHLPLPAKGTDPGRLVRETAELLMENSLFNGHPRFFGYITASPAPVGMLADLLAAAVNPNAGAWTLSPMATEIEAQTVRWIAEFIGYPVDCGGLLVSGGNVANFVGFLAARAAAGKKWKIRETGLNGPGPKGYGCIAPSRPTPGSKRRRICSGWGRMPSGSSPRTPTSGWSWMPSIGPSRRIVPGGLDRSSWWAPPGPPAPAPWTPLGPGRVVPRAGHLVPRRRGLRGFAAECPWCPGRPGGTHGRRLGGGGSAQVALRAPGGRLRPGP